MKLIDRIIQHLKDDHTNDLSHYTIVFPNKRAGLFFRKNLRSDIKQHMWSPKVLSITEFIESHSPLRIADKFTLVFELYNVFEKYYKESEPFTDFFFWGETLLADFDEIDKFQVDAQLLFRNLSQMKMLEQDLSYLTEEQQKAIEKYWKHFGDKLTRHKGEALSIWKILDKVYEDFNNVLASKGIAYQGKIYRAVAENLDHVSHNEEKVIFAGFNALSKSEENILTWYCREKGSKIFWEADDYYLNNPHQEAGQFLRSIKGSNEVLGKTLGQSFENNFLDSTKTIHVYEVSGEAAQAQVASHIIKNDSALEKDALEETAIVLPDEKLMFPVLSAIPEQVSDINITMGYPLRNGTAYSFFENLINLQIYRLKNTSRCFNHRFVKVLLYHPYISGVLPQQSQKLVRTINEQNKIYLKKDELEGHPLLQLVFTEKDNAVELTKHFIAISKALFNEKEYLTDLDREFLFRFYKIFNQLKAFLEYSHLKIELRAFHRLFRQTVWQERLPFEGEPLKGLQVMGLMETRNLSFKNIILLSANEGVLPVSKAGNISFIPQSFRTAFELPTIGHFDSIYAYLFYRLMQYAERIHIVYNTDTSSNRSGELSRFVKQLEWESNFTFEHHTVAPNVVVNPDPEFSFTMNENIRSKLMRYVVQDNDAERRFTPSAINTFFECSLRFYFRYIADIYEEDEAEEDIDARRFGNLFHRVMELVYEPYLNGNKNTIDEKEISKIKVKLDDYMDVVFREEFGLDDSETFEYQGRNVLVREVLKKLALKILEKDFEYAPFDIVGLEQKGNNVNLEINSAWGKLSVGLKGIIDRIDRKDNLIRILDYKTGKDEKEFYDISTLFEKSNNRNKAAFQTFFYGMLYVENNNLNGNELHSGLYNIRELFHDDFDYRLKNKGDRNSYLNDISGFLEEYKNHLTKFFELLYDESIVFEQTDDLNKCRFCPYAGLCKREAV